MSRIEKSIEVGNKLVLPGAGVDGRLGRLRRAASGYRVSFHSA